MVHNYTHFRALWRGLCSCYTRHRTRIAAFARGVTTGLLARLWPGGSRENPHPL